MSEGFYKRRRGIIEHLEAGKITLLDSGIHDYLCLRANGLKGSGSNIPPGVVFTSSKAIKALCPREFSERTIRRSLSHLEEIGWIKRWMKAGNRGNYPILIARASVHDLSGTEYRINAEDTIDWREPVLILAAECPGSVHEVSTYREVRIENREKPKAKAPKTAAPADSRFQPIVNAYFEGSKKAGIEPNCDKSDFGALNVWLKGNSKRSVESIVQSLKNAIASTDHYPLRRGFRLREFLEHEAKFQTGPLTRNVVAMQAQPRKVATSGSTAVSDKDALALGVVR